MSISPLFFIAILLMTVLLGALCIALIWQMRRQSIQLFQRLAAAENQSNDASQRLAAVLRISQNFVQAEDEKELLEWLLRVCVEMLGARGASFVPVDERGKPITSYTQGEMPFPVLRDWMEYLASPAVRQQCLTCENYGILSNPCPLLKGPFSGVIGLYCLEVRRGQSEFGVLNLYIPEKNYLTDENRAFIQSLVDTTSLALEAMRLRQREMETIRQLHSIHHLPDLIPALDSVLASLLQTTNADGAILFLQDEKNLRKTIAHGDISQAESGFLQAAANGVVNSAKPVLVREVAVGEECDHSTRSLVGAPIIGPDQTALGAILISSRRSRAFQQRQLALLQTVAAQASLLIRNIQQISTLEYRLLMDERTRLAREIHDGLAQTLGFLKLQAAQMQNFTEKGEWDRLRRLMSSTYAVLSEAYQDARQAIDGLRIQPGDRGLRGWLTQTAAEFEENSTLPVSLEISGECPDLAPEVHAQLIRIVQEGLSNARKHAQARCITIRCLIANDVLLLEIQDDGRGFSVGDIPEGARYGLRGMRERAELIGADFQVISQIGQGATIQLRLPTRKLEAIG